MNHNSSSSNTTSPLPTPITRYDEEFFETAYPEDNEFPSYSPTFYEDYSDTVWIRPNSLECAYERDDTIRFNLDEELPKDKELIVDYVEIVIYATGDHSNLTVELYLDNMLRTSIPYSHYQMTVFDLKKLNISEKDRTLSYSKNIMVRFTQNGRPHLNMGIGCVSPGLPAGHIRGRLKTRNRLRPKSTYHYLTDHNKNVTGLTDTQGNLVATWDYDAFGNIIQQTGAQANQNPLRFSSEYHDEDLGLIYYNYRHYNPREGRWISRDMASGGSDNPYAFIHNASQGIDILGLDYRPYTNGMGCSPSTYDSFDDIAKQKKEQQLEQCKQQRKEKMKMINNLISSQSSEEPDCSDSPTCKMVTLVIEVSDPCQEAIIQYGHAGIAVGNTFYDSGPNIIQQLGPYWSDGNPTLPQAEQHAQLVANAPVLEVKFCACQKEYLAFQLKWHLMNIFRTSGLGGPLGNTWGLAGTCSSDIARALGSSGNPFISPDDLLTDIAPSLVNSCGSKRGQSAYIKILHNPWPLK